MSLLDQVDAFGHRGVRGDPVQIAQLKDAHAQRNAHHVVELGLLAAGEEFDQVVQLRLIPQAAEHDAFGQSQITRIARFAAEQIGGIAAAVDALEYSEGNFTGRGHLSSMAARG